MPHPVGFNFSMNKTDTLFISIVLLYTVVHKSVALFDYNYG